MNHLKNDGATLTPVKSNEPITTFEGFVARLTVKERTYAEKRNTAMDADPARQALWQRLAARLLTLSGHSAKVNSAESIQFYAPDGKYKMQVFALLDNAPGQLSIYCRDVLDTLVTKKLLRKPAANTARYPVAGTEETLTVERVLPQAAEHPPAYRDLLSWNRKCMRIDLAVASSPALLKALDEILALSLPEPKA